MSRRVDIAPHRLHGPWLGALLSLTATACANGSPKVPADAVATPEWAAPGELSVRSDPGGKGLLLRHSASPQIVLATGSGTAEKVTSAAWERADTPVAACAEQSAPPLEQMWIEPHSQRLLAGDEEVPLAAPIAVAVGLSPSGDRVAALSAQGPPRRSLLPFVGGGGGKGGHFHQLLRATDARPLTAAQPVAVAPVTGPIGVCWSADERFVVYHDALFTHFSIVRIPTSQAPDSKGKDP